MVISGHQVVDAYHAVSRRERLLKVLEFGSEGVEPVRVHAVQERLAHAVGGLPVAVHVKLGCIAPDEGGNQHAIRGEGGSGPCKMGVHRT